MILKKIVLYGRIRILKGRGFRGGSDEKMKRMWFGLEIDVVGLPPLPGGRAVRPQVYLEAVKQRASRAVV